MNRLKLLREERQLSQNDIATIINKSQKAISNYESGKRDMSSDIQRILANFFGVSIDYLMGNSDVRESNILKLEDTMLKIGLDMKEYNPPTAEQKKQIEEFAKYVLKDNKKD